MRQTLMGLLIVLAIAVVILVWQNTVVVPEIDSISSVTATTTVPEVNTNGELLPATSGGETLPLPNEAVDDDIKVCTMDAKQCPDGSYVGRVAPSCVFADCPIVTAPVVVCTDTMKNAKACPAIYAPVCGLVEIQCITTPCNPIPETFSSGCSACSWGNVISYTAGACAGFTPE